MTLERIPHLTDLVMIFLKERYPYWKFRYGESGKNALLDTNGYAFAIVYDISVQLLWSSSLYGFHDPADNIKAADPEFFELLSKHIIAVKREQLR